ncbi:hypothetical protein [Limnochorda pilosa]|uniref:PepSY domain-containing protein n=1 Tax=Limnochorda pilosa TaxID=1555112 RepID=A0A0K2SR16_LIMPI|nr:hypothetical protein [Limnochorda pilosa]BAS29259.1 hypothetical protein LIP_3447 [Limnochorda pilosa]
MRGRTLWILLGGLVLVGGLYGATLLAQPAGPQNGSWAAPGAGAGYGMMSGYGGMMGGSGGMMGGYAGPDATPLTSLDDAKRAFEAYVDSLGVPGLEVAEVMQFQNNFYAIVAETASGEGAFELLADPRTGAVFPEYGPNMMWNTRYGHMGGYGGGGMMGGGMMGWDQPGPAGPGDTAQGSVSPERAQELGQAWLDANFPGSTAVEPDPFPGYYTLHIERDGTITGMLSVNASTGQVWYHGWHGTFVAMSEGH